MRVAISSLFLSSSFDTQTFDLRSIKKTCIHIAHPHGERLVPDDTYNMFYRDDLEPTRLGTLRNEVKAVRQAAPLQKL